VTVRVRVLSSSRVVRSWRRLAVVRLDSFPGRDLVTAQEPSPRRALLAGGTGFVGRTLARLLRGEGWHVSLVARASGSDREGVVADEIFAMETPHDLWGILDRAAPTTVFHLAAHQSRGNGRADIEEFVDANLRLGLHLFGAAAEYGVPVVNALTYFQFRGGLPATHSLYSATKQAQAEFARFWRERLGADIRDVVLFDNYGPCDTRDKLIPGVLAAITTGQTFVVGPLDQPVDLLHVRDVAAGLVAVAAAEPSEVPYAIRASSLVTVGEIIAEVEHAAGRKVALREDRARQASNHPVVAGQWDAPPFWRPTIPLRVGIAECVEAAS